MWGDLVNQFGAFFFKVGRVGEKVGRLGVGRLASGATCHAYINVKYIVDITENKFNSNNNK